jgi:hypothetical protein
LTIKRWFSASSLSLRILFFNSSSVNVSPVRLFFMDTGMNIVGSLPLWREELFPQAPSSSACLAALGSAPIPSRAGRFGGGKGFLVDFEVVEEEEVAGPFHPIPRSMAAPYSSTGTAV